MGTKRLKERKKKKNNPEFARAPLSMHPCIFAHFTFSIVTVNDGDAFCASFVRSVPLSRVPALRDSLPLLQYERVHASAGVRLHLSMAFCLSATERKKSANLLPYSSCALDPNIFSASDNNAQNFRSCASEILNSSSCTRIYSRTLFYLTLESDLESVILMSMDNYLLAQSFSKRISFAIQKRMHSLGIMYAKL